MKETFAKPAVGAIIEKVENGQCYLLIQRRQKEINFTPFCVTQNLNGIYSLIMMSFICHAEGTPLASTNETTDIHWEKLEVVKDMLVNTPEKIFPMDLLPLKKYLKSKGL